MSCAKKRLLLLGFELPSKEIGLDRYSIGPKREQCEHTFTVDDEVPTVVRGTLYPPVVESVAAGSPVVAAASEEESPSAVVAAGSEEEESPSAVVVAASEEESVVAGVPASELAGGVAASVLWGIGGNVRGGNPEQMRLKSEKRGQQAKRGQQHESLCTVHIRLQGRF
jgi:hypothetical protein